MLPLRPRATGGNTPGLPTNAATEQIQSVITQQLERLRAGDAIGAFEFASPNIRKQFRDANRFMAMVAAGYPQIRNSNNAKFLDLVTAHGRLMQKVLIQGADGKVVIAGYIMVLIDGVWRIDGCFILPQAGTDA